MPGSRLAMYVFERWNGQNIFQSLPVTYNGCIQFEYTWCQTIPSFFLCIVCRGTSRMFCTRLSSFLKYSRLLFNIKNMDFKGGAVSDHTSVLTNIYKLAFPNTKMVQCHIHLERKLWKGKGNGGYTKYVVDKSFFHNTCRRYVHDLHHCLSQQQFDTLSKVCEGRLETSCQGA